MCCDKAAELGFTSFQALFKTWCPKYWKLLLVQGIWGPAKKMATIQVLAWNTWFSKSWKGSGPGFPSLDNDCTLQDLAFQVLKLFAGNSLVMDLSKNWIMSFMTWSSKTWTQVKIFVKPWLPQVWNLTYFFQDLACQVLKCYIFATPCPQVLTMIAFFKTWLSKSWNFLQETVRSWT